MPRILAWVELPLVQFSSVAQSCLTLWDPMNHSQASLSITDSWSAPKPMSTELVMPSNHLILCRPLLLLPSIFPSIRVFSNKSALCIRYGKMILRWPHVVWAYWNSRLHGITSSWVWEGPVTASNQYNMAKMIGSDFYDYIRWSLPYY